MFEDIFQKTLRLNITGNVDASLASTINKLHDLMFKRSKQITDVMRQAKRIQDQQVQSARQHSREQERTTRTLREQLRLLRQQASTWMQQNRGATGNWMAGVGGWLAGPGGALGTVGRGLTAAAGPVGAVVTALSKIRSTAHQMFWEFVAAGYALLRATRELQRIWSRIINLIAQAGKLLVTTTAKTIGLAGELEMYESRLKGVFGERAAGIFQMIVKYAQRVPYTIRDMMAAFIKLEAMGVTRIVKIGDAFEAASDLAITFDSTVEDAATALGQLYAGRADRFIRRYGIRPQQLEPYGAVLKETGALYAGTPEARARNLVAAIRFIQDRFGSATEEMANNLQQLITNMEDLLQRFALTLDKIGVTKIVSSLLATVFEMYERLEKAGWIEQWAKQIYQSVLTLRNVALDLLGVGPGAISGFLTFFQNLIQRAVWLYERMGGAQGMLTYAQAILSMADRVAAAIQEVTPKILDILPGAIRALGAVTDAVLQVWGLMIRGLGWVTTDPNQSMGSYTRQILTKSGMAVAAGGRRMASAYLLAEYLRAQSGLTDEQIRQLSEGPGAIGDTISSSTRDLASIAERSIQQAQAGRGRTGTSWQRGWADKWAEGAGVPARQQILSGYGGGGVGGGRGAVSRGGIVWPAGTVGTPASQEYYNDITAASAVGSQMMYGAITGGVRDAFGGGGGALVGMGAGRAAIARTAAGRPLRPTTGGSLSDPGWWARVSARQRHAANYIPSPSRHTPEGLRLFATGAMRSWLWDEAHTGDDAHRWAAGHLYDLAGEQWVHSRRRYGAERNFIINIDASGNGDPMAAKAQVGQAAKELSRHPR